MMFRTFLFVALFGFSFATLAGGVGDLFPANSEIQELVNIVRPNIESRANRQFSLFRAVEFRSQVVAGLNYFVKIQVEEDEYAFARIYVHFSGNPIELSAFKLNKGLHDKLDYFDAAEEPRHVVGGTGDVTPADSEIQSIVEAVRENFESNIGRKTEEFVAVHFVSQVVSGTNYFIKVKIGSNEYAFLRVYKPFSGDHQLTAYQLGKSAEENVSYFEPHTNARVGGVGQVKPATEEVQNIVNTVRGDFESKEGKQTHFQAVHYKSQVVAGANYFVKVQVSDNNYAFLRIYKHFSGSITLHSYQVGKSSQDEVEYF